MKREDNGLLEIEQVRERSTREYDRSNTFTKIQLKAWVYHSESRHRNGNPPLSLLNYTNHMNISSYLEQIDLGMLDCSDIGGNEAAITYLKERLLPKKM